MPTDSSVLFSSLSVSDHPLLQPLNIGGLTIENRLMVAPMAGVTDNPFRRLCKSFGAGHAVSEMIIADTALYARKKSLYRANFDNEIAPISAQIAGAEPDKLAEAARYQVDNGAQIIDINMGCPAKKVCRKLAGSALLQDEDLVARLLDAAVNAVDVPVTLKTRLGLAEKIFCVWRAALNKQALLRLPFMGAHVRICILARRATS
jgi:tRNA-dihydrouridine synthase B